METMHFRSLNWPLEEFKLLAVIFDSSSKTGLSLFFGPRNLTPSENMGWQYNRPGVKSMLLWTTSNDTECKSLLIIQFVLKFFEKITFVKPYKRRENFTPERVASDYSIYTIKNHTLSTKGNKKITSTKLATGHFSHDDFLKSFRRRLLSTGTKCSNRFTLLAACTLHWFNFKD